MPNGGSGVVFHGLETGREFQWVGLREQQSPTHQGGTESPWRCIKHFSLPQKKNYSWSCIGFLGNRSGGPRTGHRACPQVADRGALCRGLLRNTDTKLNKQPRTMFQGWSRRNNPRAKVLSTVPRAAWHQEMVSHTVSHTVSLGNQATPRVLRPYPCMRSSAGAEQILP